MKNRLLVMAVAAAIGAAIALFPLGLPVVPAVVGAMIVGLVADFVAAFFVPWRRQIEVLRSVTADLTAHYAPIESDKRVVDDLGPIRRAFSDHRELGHVWKEFEDTLHKQYSETERDDAGQLRVERYRQTVPAEAYFSQRALIDGPLGTDYFRHLPGLLTGLGIVGTFSGLIGGLSGFQISGSPERVNSSVDGLLHSVQEAFYVSGFAIAIAMLVTWVEKSAVSRLHSRLQELQTAIDQMFDAGAGEDYLSQIATQSEESASQMSKLRQGLVDDLAPLLEELGDRQVQAAQSGADAMRVAITDTFESPLAKMTSALEKTQEDQQAGVQRLLEGTLETFAQRLEQLVGEKLTGAAGSIEAAAETLRKTLESMPEKLEETIASVRRVLAEVAEAIEPMVGHAERTTTATQALATTVGDASDTLDYALTRLRALGEEMTTSVEAAGQVANSLGETSTQAQTGAEAIEAATTQLRGASTSLEESISAMREVVDTQRSDQDSHRALADAVRQSAADLRGAQAAVTEFMDGVAEALASSHGEFSQRLSDTLGRTHTEFHKNLSDATGHLAATVGDFRLFLEDDFRDSVEGLNRELTRLGPADPDAKR